MSPNTRQIAFINAAHTFTHYSLMVLPTAVLAMAIPGGVFGEAYGPILALRWRPACSCSTARFRCRRAGSPSGSAGRR
jgi:hypothetical protein